ncbi:hypothetical protein TNIN_211831 [Trichonephila inaurata madagascariensis]|uniref:Uncharacterized protein n=1 Tax=Trichonephila inaurata madagascariensis TaxID=2747483 RepID=A0A8X6X8W2_9ARAC|nr:hypothetical protein TNIN_211831 [Trichonephila inaurata madagascariensis]
MSWTSNEWGSCIIVFLALQQRLDDPQCKTTRQLNASSHELLAATSPRITPTILSWVRLITGPWKRRHCVLDKWENVAWIDQTIIDTYRYSSASQKVTVISLDIHMLHSTPLKTSTTNKSNVSYHRSQIVSERFDEFLQTRPCFPGNPDHLISYQEHMGYH